MICQILPRSGPVKKSKFDKNRSKKSKKDCKLRCDADGVLKLSKSDSTPKIVYIIRNLKKFDNLQNIFWGFSIS